MTRAREISNVLGRNIESTTFTATAGQTAFSITHAAGRIQVYMNGLLLDPTVDWTSDGSTVTLTEGAVAGDELEVVKFDNLAVADAIPRTGHTGTIDFSSATFTPPAGYVVQVVEGSSTTYHSFNNTDGWLDLTASITPTSTASKILVKVHLDGVVREDDSVSYGKNILYRNRGASQVGLTSFGYPMGWTSVDNASGTTVYCQYIDSPSTTSATTYDIYWDQIAGGAAIQQFNRDGSGNVRSSIVLMEIAQ